MKTNMINTNSIKTSICAVVMLLGFSVSAWGTATITFSPTSKTINIDATTAEGYFVFDYTTTDLVNPYGNDGLQLYIPAGGTHDGYDCGFGTTSSDVGTGHYTTNSLSSGKIVVYYDIDAEGDYSVTLTATGYTDNSYNYIQQDFVININVHNSCTARTISFEDDIEKDFGTSAAKFQDYTLSAGSGTITWSSDDPTIASVASDGVVTLHKAGWTYINVAVAANGGYCADEDFYKITVNALTPTLSNNESGKEFDVTNITSTGATFSGGVVTLKGNASITRYGFIIGTSSTVVVGGTGDNAPVASGFWDDDIALNTAFGSKTAVSNFSPNTTYYVRAFAYNGSIYGYSTAVQFKTLKQFTITLDGNGGSDGIAAVEENAAELIEITAPMREHYTLEGYYTTSACETKIANTTGELVASITVGGNNWTDGDGKWIRNTDETFYANWTPDNQTISFNANGGSGSMDAVVRGYNTVYALPACGFTAPEGKVFDGWAEGSAVGTVRSVGYTHTVAGDITFYAKWRDASYTDYVFSCAELTLTPKLVTAGAPMFITSAAGKKVRSQDSILIVGSGLTPSTALTFPDLPAKFEIKSRTGAALATDASGAINAVAYIFYTPAVGDTDDGLDEIAGITVSVGGAKPKTASLTQSIIGRHLPADFVIAVKHDDNQWYALPADMSETGNPTPVAIRVDNTSSPTTAYCDNTNAYSLYASTLNNISVQLAMPNNPYMANAALWANNAVSSTNIGKKGDTNGSSTGLGGNYQWLFTQTATSVSGIGDVKYTMSNPNNAYPLKVWTNAGSTLWGLYSSGSAEIRLLSMEVVKPLSLKVMEWGTNAIVVSYPNGGSATSPQVRIDGGDAANVTLTSLGGDIYKIATISGLQSNPAKTLIFTATESSVAKQIALAIPLIVSDAKTEADLRGAVPGANATEKNKVAKLTDVIIRNGGRLTTGTASGDFNDVYIYPGGKAKITNNFAANNIYMRGGYSFLDEKATFRYPDLCVEGAVTIDLPAANKLYYDFYIDNRLYYMFSMPYDVALSTVTDETGSEDFPVWVKHYDGNLRASGHGVSGWTWYGDDEETQHSFFAGIGYEITAKPKTSGRPIAIIRFPVITGDITTDAENSPEVTVTYHGKSAYETGTQTANNVGWNFIGNPYLTEYKAVSDTSMIVKSDFVQHKEDGQWDGTYEWKETSARFITVPYDTYNDYHHELVKGYTIPAFSTFFFQYNAAAEGTFTMGGTRTQAAAVPARFGAAPKAVSEIGIDIILNGEGEAVNGSAGLIIHDKYDGGLKDFEDVEQWFVDKNVQKTYTFADGTALAYNLLNEQAATELIPMGYIATVGGEHVYALNEENDVSALEHLWLIDYTTGVTTDLLVRNYSFVTAAGRFDSRFAINAVLKQEEVPTNISNTPGGDWTTTIGVYSGENMLTLRGLPDNSAVYIYDMNGRLLQSSEKLSNIASFSIATQGVYNIRVIAEGKAITLRTVLR